MRCVSKFACAVSVALVALAAGPTFAGHARPNDQGTKHAGKGGNHLSAAQRHAGRKGHHRHHRHHHTTTGTATGGVSGS